MMAKVTHLESVSSLKMKDHVYFQDAANRIELLFLRDLQNAKEHYYYE